jgi:hypothetical protein
MINNNIKKYVTSLHSKKKCPFLRIAKILSASMLKLSIGLKPEYNGKKEQEDKTFKSLVIILLIAFICCGCNIVGCDFSDKNNVRQRLIKVGEIELFTEEFNQIFEIVKAGYAKDINATEAKIAKFSLLIDLTNEMLLINEAKKLGVDISEQELNRAVDNIKADFPKNLFERMFIEQAISFEVWKKRLKSQLIINKLITSNLLKKVAILPEDIRKYYASPYNNGQEGNSSTKTDNNKKLLQYLRNEKAQKLYSGWFEKFKKAYSIEIDRNQWQKIFGE